VGTAYLLAHVGVPLIDTTSFGAMATRGLPGAVGLATRDFMLGNARLIAAAVDLPVQADFENGFGDSPEIVAQTILEAGTTGIVGGSIEDATGHPADPIYPFELAKERIRAAAEVARALPFPFMLTARTDQYLWGRPDLAEVIRRAQAASASVKGYPQSAVFAIGKFALRGLAQSMARELAPKGIHVAHFVIDGGVRNAEKGPVEGANMAAE
jgi:2-methylisocitrate lyase-like PEP mutase family enzyme